MKMLSIFLSAVMLLGLSGCSFSKPDIVATDSIMSPILFATRTSLENHSAYVLCIYEDGVFRKPNEFKYDGKEWNEFIGSADRDVKTNFVKTGDELAFYSSKGEKILAECEKVFCRGRGIDEFTEVHANIISEFQSCSKALIGFNSSQNPYPFLPKYDEDSIVVDIDNDRNEDMIRWSFEDSEHKIKGQNAFNYVLVISINGVDYCYENPSDLPLAEKTDLDVFVADLNGDGTFEILVYTVLAGMMEGICVYTVVDNNLLVLLDYVINPGP